MFYKQFSEISNELNSDFVNEFDFWLATLPKHKQKNITASVVSSKFDVHYSIAKCILEFCEKKGILKKEFIIRCPICDEIIEKINDSNLIADILFDKMLECDYCEKKVQITTDNIYAAYAVIQAPDATETEIKEAILRRIEKSSDINFTQADSLSNDKQSLYQVFYNPSDSAYEELKEMKEKLDNDYGKNTTKKGSSLEKLVLKIFLNIRTVSGTTEIKTSTNQFDCTFQFGLSTIYLSVFNLLTPYFIVECKNESKKPGNNYMNKLQSILSTNNAKLGIIFARKEATKTCFETAREHYLLTKGGENKIIITCSDNDLDYIIDKKVNLLSYIEFKVNQITMNSPSSKYEDFYKKSYE